jgi:hypothetical protein
MTAEAEPVYSFVCLVCSGTEVDQFGAVFRCKDVPLRGRSGIRLGRGRGNDRVAQPLVGREGSRASRLPTMTTGA